MQSNRTWGDTNTVTDGGGSGQSSGQANNQDTTVGIHQAYFTIKNFANLPLGFDAKVGRQEIKLDGWRLFGNTIWTMGMQTHDAIRMTHKHDNMTLNLGYILRNEDGRDQDQDDANDWDVYLAHLNLKGVLGGQFSGYYVYSDNGCNPDTGVVDANQGGCNTGNDDFHTIGGRQAGNMFGLKYRAEAYYQFGNATGIATDSGGAATDGAQVDREAYMFGVRVTKAFNNTSFKPAVTLWYDYVSGTSDQDQRDGKWKSFDTLYDTGHKFYGLQDMFLGLGAGGATGTQGLGMQDLAVKLKMNPIPGWTLKADYHYFYTAESVNANTTTRGVANNASTVDDSHFLGNELDITAIRKLNSGTKVMIGYSNYSGSSSFRLLKGAAVAAADANWAYVQFDVKF
jgi:hypothetical protein